MKIRDIKLGDEVEFGDKLIRITGVEQTEIFPRQIILKYDIITDLFNFGKWSFYVFYECDWDRDIEDFGKNKNEEEYNDEEYD